MSKKKVRGRPREFELYEVLDKAVEVFWELGYEAADTETLSTKMGLSKPSIYNTFGSKEELFLMALRRYGATVSDNQFDILFNGKSPKDGLHAFFSTIAQDVAGQHNPSGCLIACVAISVSGRMPKVATAMHELLIRQQERMKAYFEAELEKGMLPSTFNVSVALSLIQDLIISMGFRGRMGTSLEELEELAVRNAELVMLIGVEGE